MTEELKTTMTQQADHLEPFSPDVEAITGAGRRRLRRRRLGAAGAGVAVVLAVGLGGPQLVGGNDPADDKDKVAVTESAPSTWAEGSVIHVGDTSVDVGHPIHSFVATTVGFVTTDPDGKVWSTVNGTTARVGDGTADYGRQLVADGEWAGWIQFTDGEAPRFVFLDQSTGSTVDNDDGTVPGMGPFDSGKDLTAQLFALDGKHAYLSDTRGLVRYDVDDGSSTVLAGPDLKASIDDVEHGEILHSFQGDDEATVSSPDVTTRTPELAVRGGDLSPTGRYVMSENSARSSDDFTLLEVGTGAELTPPAKGDYAFFTGYAWIDDTSYMALGIKDLPQGDTGGNAAPEMPTDLLRCEVAARTCEVVQPGLDFSKVQLPIGENIGD